MKLKVNLNYNVPKDNKDSSQEITSSYLQLVINDCHKNGIKGQLARVYGRLQRKLDEAIKDKLDFITLDEAEKDLVKKSFEDPTIPPHISKYFIVLDDEVSRMLEEYKKNKEKELNKNKDK